MEEGSPMTTTYRVITRSDFDGLVCAVLLQELGMVHEILFVHPKEMQDGKIEVTSQDITTNLPYVEGVHLAFDHHHSEMVRRGGAKPENHIIDPNAPSAARVVYDYYGGANSFPDIPMDMMEAVDKADSANFTEEEIVNPTNWVLLNFLMDSRTGLGRFHNFSISNYQLMLQLIDRCQDTPIDDILELPDVAERVELYHEHQYKFIDQVKKCATVFGNLVVLDFRNEEVIYAGNRFIVYALFPETNISIHVIWGPKKERTVFAMGKSILKRDSNTNVGELCLKYGGGGHQAAGTCQVENEEANDKLKELIAQINADG